MPVTERLLLRQWQDLDREPWAALNADPEVMRHFPAPLDRAAADALVDRWHDGLAQQGWGLWAVEVGVTGEFVGMVGLNRPQWTAAFTSAGAPCTEVGWRLARSAWGHGYASEAAREAVRVAFDEVGIDEVVSFTTVDNRRSRAVMERLAMSRDPGEDFDHPRIAEGSPHRRHVLYRLPRDAWLPLSFR